MTSTPVLSINGNSFPISDRAQLLKHLGAIRTRTFSEVRLDLGNGQTLSMWVNGSHAWLMYLLNADEESYVSRNPGYHGDPNKTIDYVLANGQRDAHPASWAVSVEAAVEVMTYFYEKQALSPSIGWSKDF